MNDMLKFFLPKIFAMIQSGGRSSAIKPLLCLSVFSLVGMCLAPESIQIYGIAIKGIFAYSFACIVVVVLLSYFILLFKNPRLLQSEHYQLAMRKMDLAAQQKGKPPSFIEVTDVTQTEASEEIVDGKLLGNLETPNTVKGIDAGVES